MSPRRREQTMVPDADFRSYYGRPVMKPPVWKVPDVPAYLFLGGMAGASATMATFAEFTGRPNLARAGQVASAVGSVASVGALVHDLGRPTRFLNMLRVFKPTSPLSVGSWIIAPFSACATGAAGSVLTGWLPAVGQLCAGAAGLLGPAMTSYTAVLLSDTAVPAWHEAYRELPFLFAGSAVMSAGAVGMISVPPADAAPARRMAISGAAVEFGVDRLMRRRTGMIAEVFDQGKQGRALRVGKALTFVGAGATLLARRSRLAALGAGLCLSAGAVATRYGIFEAGRESARDPRYTVVPQRSAKLA